MSALTHRQQTFLMRWIEARAIAIVADLTGCLVKITGTAYGEPRDGSGRIVYAMIGGVPVEHLYFIDNADQYMAEGRGDYAHHLARELARRWQRAHGAAVTGSDVTEASDVVSDDETMSEETEMIDHE